MSMWWRKERRKEGWVPTVEMVRGIDGGGISFRAGHQADSRIFNCPTLLGNTGLS